jgi:ferrous iron transport protein A
MGQKDPRLMAAPRSAAVPYAAELSGQHEGCKRLIDLGEGVAARLCTSHTHRPTSGRLAELGFVPGTQLCIIRSAPLGDPIEIEIRGTRVCVRRAEIEDLYSIPESAP